MSLLMTGSRDHALLAAVVREARDAVESGGGFVGRTALQKILYGLKGAGVPMGYRFDLHHYGPYCEDISRDVEWLLADEVITDRSTNQSKYSNYAPGRAMDELLARHADYLEQYLPKIRTIVGAFAPLRPERLELITTLDYLYRQKRASGGGGPWKEAVVTRFMEVKNGKFPADEVAQVYDVLANAGLVAP